MENDIYISIATQILVMKRSRQHLEKVMTLDSVCEKIKPYFSLDLYDCYENEKVVSFVLKNGILEKYLCDYLFEISHYLFYGKGMRNDIKRLMGQSDEDITSMIMNGFLDYIHFDDIYTVQSFYMLSDLDIYFEGINFFNEGNMILREYDELFGFIHHLMRKCSDNPLKDTTYLHIH